MEIKEDIYKDDSFTIQTLIDRAHKSKENMQTEVLNGKCSSRTKSRSGKKNA